MSLSSQAIEDEKSGDYLSAYLIYQKLFAETGLNAYSLALKRLSYRIKDKKSVYESLCGLGVEKFYALSLQSQLETRFLLTRELLRPKIAVPIKFINAVHGRTNEDALNAYCRFQDRKPGSNKYSSHVSCEIQGNMKSYTSINAYGYFMTMKKIIEDAMRKGYSRIAVFDDDIFFSDNACDFLSLIVAKNVISCDWKILLLGASEYGNSFPAADPQNISFYRPSPGKTCGSFAVCYDKSIFEILLDCIDNADGTFDNNTLGHIYATYPEKSFVLYPNICIANVQSSDIRSGRNQETHSAKMRWKYSVSRYKDYLRPQSFHLIFPDRRSACEAAVLSRSSSLINFTSFYLSSDGMRPIHRTHLAQLSEDVPASNERFMSYMQNANNVDWQSKLDTQTLSWNSYSKDFTFANLIDSINGIRSFGQMQVHRNHFSIIRPLRRSNVSNLCSVVIPVARISDLYLNAVKSVCAQTYSQIELILVIDNPEIDKDVVFEAVSSVLAVHNHKNCALQVIKHSQRRYACAARNTGFFASSGEYVSFLDEDDVYLEDRLRLCIEQLQRVDKQGFAACYCGYKGNWNGQYDEARFKEGSLFNEILTLAYGSHYICTNTITFRASSFEFIGGFNESYVRHQDIELMLRFFKYFAITSVRYIGAHNCPSPREDTFEPSLMSILALKKHLISDFINDIYCLTKEQRRSFVEGHARDLARHLPAAIHEEKNAIAIGLVESLLAHYVDEN